MEQSVNFFYIEIKPADIIARLSRLTPEEQRAYLLMFLQDCMGWPLHYSPEKIAQSIDSTPEAVSGVLEKLEWLFTKDDKGFAHHVDVTKARKLALIKKQQQIEAGRKGGMKTQENRRSESKRPSSDPQATLQAPLKRASSEIKRPSSGSASDSSPSRGGGDPSYLDAADFDGGAR